MGLQENLFDVIYSSTRISIVLRLPEVNVRYTFWRKKIT